jgi:hypothetical protein
MAYSVNADASALQCVLATDGLLVRTPGSADAAPGGSADANMAERRSVQ